MRGGASGHSRGRGGRARSSSTADDAALARALAMSMVMATKAPSVAAAKTQDTSNDAALAAALVLGGQPSPLLPIMCVCMCVAATGCSAARWPHAAPLTPASATTKVGRRQARLPLLLSWLSFCSHAVPLTMLGRDDRSAVDLTGRLPAAPDLLRAVSESITIEQRWPVAREKSGGGSPRNSSPIY